MNDQFPKIEFCIVCEDARPEIGNKISILGFFGLAPNVDVHIADLNQPCRLLFLFGAEGGYGKFSPRAQLVDPDGEVLLVGVVGGELDPDRSRVMFGTGFSLPLRKKGVFSIQLLQDGKIHYENKLTIHHGTLPDHSI